MGSIILLDDLTINKIAAGEVIERPASVIKELVENSVDAGATNITVEIRNGGISYIRIIDNGKGILPDDMDIAFERHATSKIRVADDLMTVKSMGFRGEALASIAAISKIKMQSKTMDQEIGYQVVIEGGHIVSKEEVGCPNGTIIEVDDLFYNTPVRYKFLKKDFTEAGYIEDAVTRIALAHPEIAIKLINTGKTVIQTAGNGDMKSVIYNIYGKDIAENVIDINYEYEDIKVTGVIGKPEIARSNRSNQLFFVNTRYVKDKTLTSAAEQAYKDKLQVGKYGFLILNLEIDPSKIDVNVHPAKLEIRFQEEQKVFKAVYHAIKDELMKNTAIPVQNEFTQTNEVIKGFEENKVEQEVEERGLFKKLFSKKEEKQEPTILEELYETRRMNSTFENNGASNFDSIINKMAEMKKSVSEFKGIPEEEISENIESLNELRDKINGNVEKEEPKTEDVVEEIYKEENNMPEEVTKEVEATIEEVNIEASNSTEENNIEENNGVEEVYTETNYVVEQGNIEENNTDKIDVENSNAEENVQQEEKIENIQNEEEAENTDTPIFQTLEDIIQNSEQNNAQAENTLEDNEQTKSIKYDNIETINVATTNEDKENIEFDDMYAAIFGIQPKRNVQVKVEEEEEEYKLEQPELKACENVTLFDNIAKKTVPNYRYAGIAFSNYIIIEIDKEIFIINQYAANEKILYERIKENFYDEHKRDSQLMLLPDIIDVTDKEMNIAGENISVFQKAGFELEPFGENTIKLIGVPSYCMELNTKELFMQILAQINKVPMNDKEQVEKSFISTLAKNISDQMGLAETKEEANILIEKLLVLNNPFTCESGRPVAIEMKKEDIEKKFSRR